MGFFSKLANWVRGKGFKEEKREEETTIKQAKEEKIETPTIITDKKGEEYPEITPGTYKTPILPEDKPITTEKGITTPQKEITTMEKRLQRAPLKKEIEKKIAKKEVAILPIPKGIGTTGTKEYYKRLLTNNAKITDPEILEVLIKHRTELKHRFVIHYNIYHKEGLGAEIQIIGMLPETEELLYEQITEGHQFEYASQEIPIIARTLQETTSAISNASKVYQEKFRVTSIESTATFA